VIQLDQSQAQGDTTSAPAARLSVADTRITFGSTRVLHGISLDVQPGEIHALVGQNGCGKSTLAKILTGLYKPDAGSRVEVDGRPLNLPIRPDEARAAGVAVVHQSLGLVKDATVLENVRVGRLRGSRFLRRIDWATERAEVTAAFERLGRSIPLDARVGDLREDERATVAIARALQDVNPGEGLIIFDESTRALGREALEQFFQILDGIVATGTSVLLITHRLEEVVEAADRVTVMRDGNVVVAGKEVEGMTKSDLASLMLGRTLDDLGEHAPVATYDDATPITVEGLSGLRIRDLSLQVRPGEIVGLTGLGGSGYDDVPYLLAGVSRARGGTITLPSGERRLAALDPGRAIGSGIALVPEGREAAGLALGFTVRENISFPQTSRTAASGMALPYDKGDEHQLAETWIERLDVRPPRAEAVIGTMSGGNQQKVLLAKWLATGPALLLLHEPTQAVDVGARRTIVEAVRAAADSGCAVIVAGSDENELSLLCDRLLVFEEGIVREELTGDLHPARIVNAIYTGGSRAPLRHRGRAASEPAS
jgi:ribose transport system ATP-binding protein